MRKMKLIHPHKVKWCMEEFINQIHTLTYEEIDMVGFLDYIDKLPTRTAEVWSEQETFVTVKPRVCKFKKEEEHNFSAINIYDTDDEIFYIGYNIEDLWTPTHTLFRKSFTNKSSIAKGFSDIVLTLLHELGHFETAFDIDDKDYDREKEMMKIMLNSDSLEEANMKYFELPDEKAATEWGIKWLQDANNRKIAKAFEKKFFACFKEIS